MTKPYVFTCSNSSADWAGNCPATEILENNGKPLFVYAASEHEASKKACEIINAGGNHYSEVDENGELMRQGAHGYRDRFIAAVPSLNTLLKIAARKRNQGVWSGNYF